MQGISFRLLRPKPPYRRWDVAPFVTIYPVLLLVALCSPVPHWLCQLVPLLTLLSQAVTFLVNHWSTVLKARLRFDESGSLSGTSHVLVLKHFHKENKSRACICPLLRKPGAQEPQYSLEYFKQEYIYDPAAATFAKQRFDDDRSFEDYRTSVGLASPELLTRATAKYGNNSMTIPMPTFGDLIQEHLVAPFFVFQIFCTILWMLEDYWYFSMATFVMLFVFESIVVFTRLRSIERIRGMRIRHRSLLVYRNKKWGALNSELLVPGDLVCLQNKARKEEDNRLPCDMLLLGGTCTVDESILTGESIPQVKEPITAREDLQERFSLKSPQHKIHTLYGRTEVLQCVRDPERLLNLSVPAPPPRHFAIAYVLRTGFHTTQGKLVRTVLFSAERVTVESKDAFLFLFVLLCFALVASIYSCSRPLSFFPVES